MKILIRTLFITVTVLISFGCKCTQYTAPSEIVAKTSAIGMKKLTQNLELNATGARGTPYLEFNFMNHKIGLWVDDTRKRVTHADFKGNFVPDDDYYKDHNYLSRLVNARGLNFVAFIKSDGSLLGVAAPYPADYPLYEPEPNEEKWYVVYKRKYLRLTVNPYDGTLERINTGYPKPHAGLMPEPVEVAGIRFFVFKSSDGRIVAASFTPK